MLFRYYDTVFRRIRLTKAQNLYFCGPTLYQTPHIGNLRNLIFYDYLNKNIPNCKIYTNITDIDEKIYNKISHKPKNYINFIKKQYLNWRIINLVLEIKAIEKEYSVFKNILNIISFVNDLPNTYLTDSDHRLKISNNPISNIPATSFALWKKDRIGFNNSNSFKGFPGWHCECAFFIKNIPCFRIDLHGGGIDLKDIHHQNECHLLKKKQPLGWIHNGMLENNSNKISKSRKETLINTSDFIKKHGVLRLKILFMATIYYKKINLTKMVSNEVEFLLEMFYWGRSRSLGRVSCSLKIFCLKNVFMYQKLIFLIRKYQKTNACLIYQIFKFLGIDTNKNIEHQLLYLKHQNSQYQLSTNYERKDYHKNILFKFIKKGTLSYSSIYSKAYNQLKIN